jgi:small-conductance mechanosensitive channel/CRP-like cAMP-binding protein
MVALAGSQIALAFLPTVVPDDPSSGGWLWKLLWTLTSLAVTYLVNRGIGILIWDRLVARALGGKVPGILKSMVSVVVYLVAMSIVVGFVYEYDIAAFLTALGAGGVVLGLAVRGIFSDLFTGLAVNLDGNVAIQDWVLLTPRGSAAKPLLGRVCEIGWRSTQLETEEGNLLIIPNTLLAEDLVTNFSRPSVATRYECPIDLDPSVPCDRAKRILLGAARSLAATPGFIAEREPAVLVSGTSERGVEYLIRYWIKPWNPLSPTSARDAVLSRALHHLSVAGLAPAIEKTEIFYDRIPERRGADSALESREDLLASILLFAGLAAEDRRHLAADLRRRLLSPAETVVQQGDTGDTLYVIAEGAFDVLVTTEKASLPARVATLGAGDFFGEMSLLTGELRRATVRSATPAVIYELSRDTVAQLIERRPDVAEALSRAVAERTVGLDQAKRTAGPAATEAAVETLSSQVSRLMREMLTRRRRTGTVASS